MEKMFSYKGKNLEGDLLQDTMIAETEKDVADYIIGKGYFVTQIVEIQKKSLKNYTLFRMNNVPFKEIILFCRQLAMMINAGLSLSSSIHILGMQTQHLAFKEVLKNIYKQIEEGKTLTESLLRYKHIFPNIVIHMISAGELGGILDHVLDKLANYLEKDYKAREKIKTAMIYPMFVLILAILVIIYFMIFVIPNFIEMFDHMNLELPLATKMLLFFSSFMQDYGLIILCCFCVGVWIVFKMKNVETYKFLFDKAMLKIPVFGKIWVEIAMVRFSRTLGTLLHAGIPIITALEVGKNVSGNLVLNRIVSLAQDKIKNGATLSNSVQSSQFFSPMVLQMIVVGEETGFLDDTLNKIADFYESEIDEFITKLNNLLEPFLITMVGFIIGGIVISIALPMFDMIDHVYL
ncbi:type II secretion system F family protein [Anaerosinus massiliensis]|uniref:type II secretion system F family protein n=1 Tax=Massilibacillus massiliensis TaxID=1806837 RepID=UPI000DA5F7AC|nr:type II secretion system F family protein [Massilibacillus massiliensis]